METKKQKDKLIRVFLKDLKITPRKVRLVAKAVSNLTIANALSFLANSPKRAALPILKLLNSAIANAVNNHKLNLNNLTIDNILVNEGTKLKRYQPRARGVTYPIWKRFSHVEIVLKEISSLSETTDIANSQDVSQPVTSSKNDQKAVKEVVKKNGTKN